MMADRSLKMEKYSENSKEQLSKNKSLSSPAKKGAVNKTFKKEKMKIEEKNNTKTKVKLTTIKTKK